MMQKQNGRNEEFSIRCLKFFKELFEKRYFVISEGKSPSDFLLWQFREELLDVGYHQYGDYFANYYLHGDALIIGEEIKVAGANLHADLIFYPPGGTTKKVDIVDITTGIKGKHIGSFMMNTFIDFLHKWNSFFPVKEIEGELSLVDESPENKERRDAFYRKFGFSFEEKEGSRYVTATLDQLNRTGEIKGIKVLSWEEPNDGVHSLLSKSPEVLSLAKSLKSE